MAIRQPVAAAHTAITAGVVVAPRSSRSRKASSAPPPPPPPPPTPKPAVLSLSVLRTDPSDDSYSVGEQADLPWNDLLEVKLVERLAVDSTTLAVPTTAVSRVSSSSGAAAADLVARTVNNSDEAVQERVISVEHGEEPEFSIFDLFAADIETKRSSL